MRTEPARSQQFLDKLPGAGEAEKRQQKFLTPAPSALNGFAIDTPTGEEQVLSEASPPLFRVGSTKMCSWDIKAGGGGERLGSYSFCTSFEIKCDFYFCFTTFPVTLPMYVQDSCHVPALQYTHKRCTMCSPGWAAAEPAHTLTRLQHLRFLLCPGPPTRSLFLQVLKAYLCLKATSRSSCPSRG